MASSSESPTSIVSPLIDTFVPGFSPIFQSIASTFHIDPTKYLPLLILGAGLIALARYFSENVVPYFWEKLTVTAEIHAEDEVYNYLLFWLSQQTFSNSTKSFMASARTDGDYVSRLYSCDDDADNGDGHDDNDSDVLPNETFDEYWARSNRREATKPLSFTPAAGTHYFYYKGRLLTFSRFREKNRMWTENLALSCIGWDPAFIKEVLMEAQKAYIQRDKNKTVIYRWAQGTPSNPSLTWTRSLARHPRPMSTVILDAKLKQAFVDDVKEYLHPFTRRWYSNRGIPYRRGYLFHGPPGTGKTSLCFALAGQLDLKIYVLSLNSRQLTEEALATLFAALPRRCIVLLEDVDTAGITKSRTEDASSLAQPSSTPQAAPSDKSSSREPKDSSNPPAAPNTDTNNTTPATLNPGISLSALLNTIDGIASAEGRILIMTTNHPEKLDQALLRPGRVDMRIAFSYADAQALHDLFTAIYTVLEGDVRYEATDSPSQSLQDEGTDYKTGTRPSGDVLQSSTSHLHHKFTPAQISEFADEFAARVPVGKFTPAQIQGYLLRHKDAPDTAVQKVEEWVKEEEKDGKDAVWKEGSSKK
ncbi:hypothetical protein AJ80_07860 [Polytolypa hystricis UAMH7299]|uniref:P-loop containing nucleoside triphosphate hydrolase protein n=1 Tax=Polytolypa hystricis (strain UAMH7299) TaxID=1447883 RepID=A0A2B7XI62_POLH7|nr:hypothetical protein AJ80_07860 [Polytolypa hystricis UAMH7299]